MSPQDNILLRHGLWPRGDAGPSGDTTWCGDDDTLAVVIDFGECLDCMDGGGVGSFRSGDLGVGAPVYVSPERDRAVEGARAREVDYGGYDAWAFGLMLHRMLGGPAGGGMLPFPGAVPRGFTDAEYAPPLDVTTAGLPGGPSSTRARRAPSCGACCASTPPCGVRSATPSHDWKRSRSCCSRRRVAVVAAAVGRVAPQRAHGCCAPPLPSQTRVRRGAFGSCSR